MSSEMNNDEDERTLRDVVLYARTGKADKLQIILDSHPDLLELDYEDFTPIMHASFCGKASTVAMLLERGADYSRKTNEGFTPLMLAAHRGATECVRLLLAAGADPEGKDHGGRTALDHAVERKAKEVVELLRPLVRAPWIGHNLAHLTKTDPLLARQAEEFINKAISDGQRGSIDPWRTKGPWPEWYRRLLSSAPLAGLVFTTKYPGRDWVASGTFMRGSEIDAALNDAAFLFDEFGSFGVIPIAYGDNGDFWTIKHDGTSHSPVSLWDLSAMKPIEASPSFVDLLKGAGTRLP